VESPASQSLRACYDLFVLRSKSPILKIEHEYLP
jgi:hypothetical protein